ncbi:MAG: acetate kinase [Bacteroidetes bacterium]|nr:acetate kinase [Bacteroidota bacterium]
MNVLVLNSGSSSLKFQIIQTDLELIASNADRRLASGLIERIGSESIITLKAEEKPALKKTAPIRNHRMAIDHIVKWINNKESGIAGVQSLRDIHAVGHRIVHGGEKFTHSTLLDESIVRDIQDCIDLAPLHNPANLKGIYAIHEIFGDSIPQAAVFDTAFHHTMPDHAYLYAIPYAMYRRHKVRRYGFHGTSHRYVAYRYRLMNNLQKKDVNVISLHLGNGCSICAIQNGVSVDTSMGMTPLEGLVMGTRSGDLDAAVLQFLTLKEGFSLAEVESILNKQSGLLGISGLTNDMREIIEEAKENDDRRAKLAISIFVYRVRKYIGSYLSVLKNPAAIIFTGGIGENSDYVRSLICKDMHFLGVKADEDKNKALNGNAGDFATDSSKLGLWVIPTNEELLIARDTVRCVARQELP